MDVFVRNDGPSSKRLALFRAGESGCLAGAATCARGATSPRTLRQPRPQGLFRYLPAPHGAATRTYRTYARQGMAQSRVWPSVVWQGAFSVVPKGMEGMAGGDADQVGRISRLELLASETRQSTRC